MRWFEPGFKSEKVSCLTKNIMFGAALLGWSLNKLEIVEQSYKRRSGITNLQMLLQYRNSSFLFC